MPRRLITPFRSVLVLAVCCFLLAAIWFIYGMQKVNTSEQTRVDFTIEKGERSSAIAARLREHNLIRSASVFRTYLFLAGKASSLQTGVFELSTALTPQDIAKRITSGENKNEATIVLIEGMRADEMADLFGEFRARTASAGDEATVKEQARAEYQAAVSNTDLVATLDDIPTGKSLEGFLFPDTYRLYRDASATDVIKKQLTVWSTKVDSTLRADIAKRGKTIFDVITLASIVQDEVHRTSDMEMVAGVYWNRLDRGMKLESDATVNYVTRKNTPQPSFADTRVTSPYNTYLNKGLPPGPIGSPGIDAIRATVHPAAHDYLYFLTRRDTGDAIYAKTYEEHLANQKQYLPSE